MTNKERQFPKMLNASRKKRIAAGSGTKVQEINQLVKMHKQMSGMMKKMRSKGGMKAMMGMAGQAGLSPTDLAKMGGSAAGLPGLGSGGLPPGLGGPKK